MHAELTVDIGKQYSRYPAGRKEVDGPYSGEGFRNKFLTKPLRESKIVRVALDNTAGYGSSFLEESFGGLVRDGFRAEFLRKHLKPISEDDSLIAEIWSYIDDQDRRGG